MIPDLDGRGLLPVGVHECSMEELRDRFGVFQTTDRRCRLFERLAAFVDEARITRMAAALIIDGSFVTAEPSPEDVDLIVLVPAGHDFSAELRPFEYNILSRRMVQKRFGLDVLVAPEGSDLQHEYVVFFQQVRGEPSIRKGLLLVRP
jgi:hypothetical protein